MPGGPEILGKDTLFLFDHNAGVAPGQRFGRAGDNVFLESLGVYLQEVDLIEVE